MEGVYATQTLLCHTADEAMLPGAFICIRCSCPFLGMLSITNEAILNISRTAGTTIATFVLTMLLLSVVYGGYEIGVQKNAVRLCQHIAGHVFYRSDHLRDAADHEHQPQQPGCQPQLLPSGARDLALLFGAFILQLLMIYLFVALGYRYYFRINPPLDCCIVASSQELAEHVAIQNGHVSPALPADRRGPLRMPGRKADHSVDHDVVFLAGIPDTEEAPAGSLLLQAQQNHLPVGRAGGCGHLHRPAKHSG